MEGLLIAVIFPSADFVGSLEVVSIVMTENFFKTAFALKSAKN